MPPRVQLPLAALAATSVVLLTSCSDDPVKATPAAHATTSLCSKASAHWPTTVGGKSAYPVTTPSNTVRAWGTDADSAVVARCGVDSPGPTTDACLNVDNVDWVQTAVTGGYRFITYGRTPAVEVLVPKAASSTPGMLLPAFTDAAGSIPQGSHHCD